MASNGSFSGSIRDGHYAIRVDWTQAKNVSANTSTITCKIYLVNDWSLSINGRTDNTMTIDGSAQTFSSPSIGSTGTHLLGTVSKSVNHKSDGSKSLSMSFSFKIRATISGTYYEAINGSTTVTLDSIPRASSVSMKDTAMGSAGTITISRASSSFTHTLTYTFGTAKGTIATKTTAASVSWTPPLSLANQIPNAVSGVGTLTCTTYNGNTSVGSKSINVTLTVPASVKPTLTNVTAARIDGDVPSSWGIYVQNKSSVKLTINGAAGAYSSTIKSYSISGGSYTGTDKTLTTGALVNSGSLTFTAKVTDSRGRVSDAKTVTIRIEPYSAPAFSSYLSQRCLSNGTLDEDGTYVHALLRYGYASCNGKNTVTTKTEYRKAGDSQWTNAGKTFVSGTAVVFGNGQISADYSYEVQYSLTDAFGTVSITDVIPTAAVVMDFKQGGKGVAVGKVAEKDNTFEVSEEWDVRVYGRLLKDYIQSLVGAIYPVGSIYLSVKPTNPSAYFGGTWVAWGSGRVPVGINTGDSNFNIVEKTGGASTVTLTASQMPSHNHAKGTLAAASGGAHTHNLRNQKAAWGVDGGGNRVLVDAISGYTAITNKATASGGAHTHTISGSTASAGSGSAHSNLQPYIVCYMWKRTA